MSSHKAAEIYFYVGYSRQYKEVMVVMSPIEYFEKNNCVLDQHLGIRELLPDFMGECGECLFDTSKSILNSKKELLSRGFIENNKFAEFCKNHDPFC